MRTHYKIIMTFTYKNGMKGGVLCGIVNSKAAIDVQLKSNRAWLAVKGHTETGVTIKSINSTY